MKAQPAIEAVESIIKSKKLMSSLIKEEVSADADGGFGKTKKTKCPLEKGKKQKEGVEKDFAIILPSPSKDIFTQKTAHTLSETQDIIFVCTRYEGIDYRFQQYMKKKYPKQFQKISL
jgi:tRNA (guanine-N1)-methyltransferase